MSSVVACKKIFNEQHPLIYTPINTRNENRGGIIYPVVKTILKKIPIKVIITDNQQDITFIRIFFRIVFTTGNIIPLLFLSHVIIGVYVSGCCSLNFFLHGRNN